MSTRLPAKPRRRTGLQQIVHRANLTLALGAVLIVGLTMGIPALLTLRLYSADELRLVGSAVSHTVEAAVVFEDSEAAQEALTAIVSREAVAHATIMGRDGRVIAAWHDDGRGLITRLGHGLEALLGGRETVLPVTHDGLVVGQVRLQGNGRSMMHSMIGMAAAILICQTMTVVAALFFSGRLLSRILMPLAQLVQITTSVQRDRAFGRRVPPSEVEELDELGTAFNALLAELQLWQAGVEVERARLSHQATHDGLTGLPNRSFFEGRLNRALTDARQSGTRVGVMLADCDRFKTINDTLGHAAGDLVLIAVAARLKGQVREEDLVARLGGDEFALLIAPVDDEAVLHRIAQAIQSAMEVPIETSKSSTKTSLSIGIAIFPDSATTASAVLDHADAAMYRAKRRYEDGPQSSVAPDGAGQT